MDSRNSHIDEPVKDEKHRDPFLSALYGGIGGSLGAIIGNALTVCFIIFAWGGSQFIGSEMVYPLPIAISGLAGAVYGVIFRVIFPKRVISGGVVVGLLVWVGFLFVIP